MKEFKIWEEGYLAQGMEGVPAPARLVARIQAETFDEAVEIYANAARETDKDFDRFFQKQQRMVSCEISDEHPLGRKWATVYSYWGCSWYDNEADARKAFG